MKTIAKRITVLLVALAVSVTFVPTVGSTTAYAAEAEEQNFVLQESQIEMQNESGDTISRADASSEIVQYGRS